MGVRVVRTVDAVEERLPPEPVERETFPAPPVRDTAEDTDDAPDAAAPVPCFAPVGDTVTGRFVLSLATKGFTLCCAI